jgi:AcrR family transcriptional regulator
MSKSGMNTRVIILDKALEMFNERGIEYVGLRELAATLDMRVSNITYYFPTKDDLVYDLSLELSKTNAAVVVVKDGLSMSTLLEMLQKVFENQVKFRCLLLSVVHLMQQNKHMATTYKQTQKERRRTIQSNLQALVKAGYLKIKDEGDLLFLVSTLSLISRFWISEAAVSFKRKSAPEEIQEYLLLIAKLFFPYCTAKGKKDIQLFIEAKDK